MMVGDTIELASVIALIVRSGHSELMKRSPQAALEFRQAIEAVINRPGSPVWEELPVRYAATVVFPTNRRKEEE